MTAAKHEFIFPETLHVLEDFKTFERVQIVLNGERHIALRSKKKSWNLRLAKMADPHEVEIMYEETGLLMLVPKDTQIKTVTAGKAPLNHSSTSGGDAPVKTKVSEIIEDRTNSPTKNDDQPETLKMFRYLAELERLENALVPDFLLVSQESAPERANLRWKLIIPVAIICVTAPGIISSLF